MSPRPAQCPPAFEAGEGTGRIAGRCGSTAHPALRSKPVLLSGAEQNLTLVHNECHCLQHAYGSLSSSLTSTPSPKPSVWASPQPWNAQRPVNKLSVLPNQQIGEWCNLFSLPYRCTSGNDFTVFTSKSSLGTFSKRQWQFARTSQLNYRKLSKNPTPPLNFPKILPSFTILFRALLNTCHSPWCKQEHFSGVRYKDSPYICEAPFSLHRRIKIYGYRHYKRREKKTLKSWSSVPSKTQTAKWSSWMPSSTWEGWHFDAPMRLSWTQVFSHRFGREIEMSKPSKKGLLFSPFQCWQTGLPKSNPSLLLLIAQLYFHKKVGLMFHPQPLFQK